MAITKKDVLIMTGTFTFGLVTLVGGPIGGVVVMDSYQRSMRHGALDAEKKPYDVNKDGVLSWKERETYEIGHSRRMEALHPRPSMIPHYKN